MLSLFKLGDDYYVFLKYNAGLSDEGSLYQYKSSLTKVATLDSGKISGLKKKWASKKQSLVKKYWRK